MGRASLSALVSRDRIEALRESKGEEATVAYRNTYLWATFEHQWSDRASSRLIGSFTDVTNERSGTVDEPDKRVGAVNDDRFFHVAGLRIDTTYAAHWLAHRFGAEIRQLEAEYDYFSEVRSAAGFPLPDSPVLEQTSRLAPQPQGYETSAYWDARADFGARWTGQLGLRFDTQTYDGSAAAEQWSPSLSVLYRAGADTRLRANLGRYYQSQGINELPCTPALLTSCPTSYWDAGSAQAESWSWPALLHSLRRALQVAGTARLPTQILTP